MNLTTESTEFSFNSVCVKNGGKNQVCEPRHHCVQCIERKGAAWVRRVQVWKHMPRGRLLRKKVRFLLVISYQNKFREQRENFKVYG